MATLALLVLASCSSRPLDPTGEDTGTDDESTSDSGDSSSDETTGADEFSCDCVELESVCSDDVALATNDCALPSPCGVVNGEAEAAACVLNLLIAGQPARFEYSIATGMGCGNGTRTWQGWFYILGPGQGLDNECYVDACNTSVDKPITMEPSASYYIIESAAYYEACLGGDASTMTGCIFNGLSKGSSVAECGP